VLDRWIVARLQELVREVSDGMNTYDTVAAGRPIRFFIDDLSTWYVRRSRERFKKEGDDQRAALATLQHVLMELSKVMAPFMPFISEWIYKAVGGSLESVHLEAWPQAEASLIREDILENMGQVRSIVSRALERRSEAGINVRQVLAGMTIVLPSGELAFAYQELVKDEVNIKSISIQKGDYAVELDLQLTPELVREGTVREIIRRVNDLRKTQGLSLADRIELYVTGEPEVMRAIEEHKEALLHGTIALSIRTQGTIPDIHVRFRANEFDITIGFVMM
jgi:isoleucyl-tRNA synthetase